MAQRNIGEKLRKRRELEQVSLEELAKATHITKTRLIELENNVYDPTGDEVLIISAYYKEDFKYFITNQKVSAIEQVEVLYRSKGEHLSKNDRKAIFSFLYQCTAEQFALDCIEKQPLEIQYDSYANSRKKTTEQGQTLATQMRKHFDKSTYYKTRDYFGFVRSLGIHVFRRKLESNDISGMYIEHPIAKKCILINYSEDTYRQNFSLLHELCHALLDNEMGFNLSLESDTKNTNDSSDNFAEYRANHFAGAFLVPSHLIEPYRGKTIDVNLVNNLALKTHANPQVVLIRMKTLKIITKDKYQQLKKTKLRKEYKEDVELLNSTDKLKAAKQRLIEKGLSPYYVRNCYEAYNNGFISRAKLAQMFDVPTCKLGTLLEPFKLKIDSI